MGITGFITVHARSEELDHNGMVIDFTIIKERFMVDWIIAISTMY